MKSLWLLLVWLSSLYGITLATKGNRGRMAWDFAFLVGAFVLFPLCLKAWPSPTRTGPRPVDRPAVPTGPHPLWDRDLDR